MPKIAVQGDMIVGHGSAPVTATGFETINGNKIIRIGDAYPPHGPDPQHPGGTMQNGSSFYSVDGKMICFDGCVAPCGCILTATTQKMDNVSS